VPPGALNAGKHGVESARTEGLSQEVQSPGAPNIWGSRSRAAHAAHTCRGSQSQPIFIFISMADGRFSAFLISLFCVSGGPAALIWAPGLWAG
jgi:hypothetical protein